MTTTFIPILIALLLGIALGAVVGSLWGLGQHRHIYDWLSASLISRMQQAMRSCGFGQDEIDLVTHRMGCKIMSPNIPCPPPLEKPEERMERVEWSREAIVPESEESLLQRLTGMNEKMILNYLRHEQYEELEYVANLMLDRWQRLTTLAPEYHQRLGVKICYSDFKATGLATVIFTYKDE